MYTKAYIYAIALTNGKYYISSSNDLHTTFKRIFSNKEKDKWLTMHKPIYVHRVIRNGYLEDSSNSTEDQEYEFLKKYINMYGIDNVRGSLFDSSTIEEMALMNAMKSIGSIKTI
jgi:hypothetical protein